MILLFLVKFFGGHRSDDGMYAFAATTLGDESLGNVPSPMPIRGPRGVAECIIHSAYVYSSYSIKIAYPCKLGMRAMLTSFLPTCNKFLATAFERDPFCVWE